MSSTAEHTKVARTSQQSNTDPRRTDSRERCGAPRVSSRCRTLGEVKARRRASVVRSAQMAEPQDSARPSPPPPPRPEAMAQPETFTKSDDPSGWEARKSD